MQDKQPLMDEMSERHALTLMPGEGLVGLSVFQIDQPHQYTLTNLATLATKDIRLESGICGSAIFRGTAGRDLAIFTQWMDQRAYDQAPQTLLSKRGSSTLSMSFPSGPGNVRLSSISLHALFPSCVRSRDISPPIC
jgi:hypothetical protein